MKPIMDFYTIILRKSRNYWVALCLENGIVGQGVTQEDSIRGLKEAVDSFEEARSSDENIYCQPISINELLLQIQFLHSSAYQSPGCF